MTQLEQVNRGVIARMAARREVRALRKAKKEIPDELRARAGFTNGRGQTPRKLAQDLSGRRVTLQDLRHDVKARWPGIKGLVDAKPGELQRILHAGHQGQGIVVELQETWKKRCRVRHEMWMQKKVQAKR